LFCGVKGAFTIGVNRPTFKYKRCAVIIYTDDVAHRASDKIVLLPVIVKPVVFAAPRVKLPTNPTALARLIHEHGRSNIAHPRIVKWDFHQTYV
ncbi:hypothetical protein D039_3991B, partial [Vibrio parahaemolyticus EKP-028]